jgi:hypothetical protein
VLIIPEGYDWEEFCGKMKKSNFYLITVGLLLLVFIAVASVSAATITLTSPNGGESWQRGTTHTVTWGYTDFPAGAPVKIVLLKAGAEVGTIITSTSIGIGGNWYLCFFCASLLI